MPVEGQIIDSEWTSGSGLDRIKFLYYEDVNASGGEAVYDEQPVRGRSEEHPFYSHTTAEVYNLNIKLVASVDQGDGGTSKQIYNDYLFIKSFEYPNYGPGRGGPMLPPRKAIIIIPEWFRHRGLIKGVQATFSKVHDDSGFPIFIDVNFQFRVVSQTPRDLFDIRQLRARTV